MIKKNGKYHSSGWWGTEVRKIFDMFEERGLMDKELEFEFEYRCAHCGGKLLGDVHSEGYDKEPFYCSESCYGRRKKKDDASSEKAE